MVLQITIASAQPLPNAKRDNQPDYFRQLEEWLPTPNAYRAASGQPGPAYWQQQADYEIDVALDDRRQRIEGRARIRYYNRSPQSLSYVWIQLDQNRFRADADSLGAALAPDLEGRASFDLVRSLLARESFNGGYTIHSVTDGQGQTLPHTVVKTMMRIDLPEPLAPGDSLRLEIAYAFNIVDATLIRARGGYEFFEEDGNYIYEIAQWYPRLVAYTDYTGWQHKQFLGRGEFTLELGNYRVAITVPADHIVAATGTLQNPDDVLSEQQRERLQTAATADSPQFIVTPEEAKQNEKDRDRDTKTWIFAAENVRDFAFASSRKFIWDAMGHPADDHPVMAMSFYPNEGEPLWSRYSTQAIVHTLDVYSRYTFAYPYPTAISVNGPVYGMEYPMICFNGPRPEKDGTYSERIKYGLISVIIHEVGHNYFPMIVNSDERQWTWMDEGLNTFLQYLAEQEWEEDYPSRRGEPADITGYMKGSHQVPIMTNSESILQFGPNGYGKPATALNVLRETILGRELFDFAFREYALRWKFRRPTPADFFRTMEDASGVDLDWFWRGWFYSTDHVDIAIDSLRWYQIDAGDPDEAAERKRQERKAEVPSLSKLRNQDLTRRVDLHPGLKDFYNDYDDLEVTEDDRKAYRRFVDKLDAEERKLLKRKTNFYVVRFRNVGGLVMPIILQVHFQDGTQQLMTIPVEIWTQDGQRVDKLIITDKQIQRLELDPHRQLADTEISNNHWPPRLVPSRFKLFKDATEKNPMQKLRDAQQNEKAADAAEAPAAGEKTRQQRPPVEKETVEKGQQQPTEEQTDRTDGNRRRRPEREPGDAQGEAAEVERPTVGPAEGDQTQDEPQADLSTSDQ